jgi:hypothetical protein
LPAELGARSAVLDGEIVCLERRGRRLSASATE